MFDMEDICDALAARYLPATIGTPTNGVGMRASYGQAPNSIPSTPAVVVLPKSGTLTYQSGTRDSEHDIDVLFFYARREGDVPRSETQRQRWLPLLLNALHGQVKLGLSADGVQKAFPVDYEFTELTYAGDDYDGIRITVRVWITEPVTLTP